MPGRALVELVWTVRPQGADGDRGWVDHAATPMWAGQVQKPATVEVAFGQQRQGHVDERVSGYAPRSRRQGAFGSERVSSMNWHHVIEAFTARCAWRAVRPTRLPLAPCPVP